MKFTLLSTACWMALTHSSSRSTLAFQTPNQNVRNRSLQTKTGPGFSYNQRTVKGYENSASTSTSLSSALLPEAITSPIGSISVLAFVILIHEAGHFLAARSFGMKVKEFSVGVGPKITGFKRGGVRDENGKLIDEENDEDVIEFNLRAIPLGGYVRFPENYNATIDYQFEVQAEEQRQEIQKIIDETREANGAKQMKSGVIRPLIQKVLNSKTTEEERLAALEALNLKPTNAIIETQQPWWKTMFGNKNGSKKSNEKSIIIEDDGTITVPPTDYYDDPDLLQNRPWPQRAVVLAGGVVFNILLAFTLYFGEMAVGPGLASPTFEQGAIVSSIPRANSPSDGLLDRGDVIISLNGQALTKSTPTKFNAQDTISNFIEDIRSTAPGDALHLSVIKAGTKETVEVDIKPTRANENDPKSPLSIGVMIGPNYVGSQLIKASNPIEAAVIAGTEVYEETAQTARSILTYLGGLLLGGSAPAGQSLSGPIGVIKTGSSVVSTKDITAVIGFAAAISVNLAVVNSLPLPALDGGQMLFVLSEALTGRKIDQKKQEAITSSFLLFLLIVSLSTAVGDITSLGR